MTKKKDKIYAIYKGDKFLYMGTKEELAKELNVKKATVQFMTSNVYKERRKNSINSLIVIEVEEDEE